MTNKKKGNGRRRRRATGVATLIDGKGTGQTGQFLAIDGGLAEE